METLSAETQDGSSEANPSSVKSDDSSPQHDSARGSPPPNCAICLGTCRNKSFTDSCLHQFCFNCLLTWSKVKAECPLCKQNFKSIIHNVQSNHQYEEYLVEQRHTEEATERIDIDNLTGTATRRFRYRTTVTLPRRQTIAFQQLLLHFPLAADVFPPPRRSPAAFRRTVYRHNLWARPLPDFTGRFRDCTPEFYRYNNSQIHRLVPWLNRELHYLLYENAGHISYVLARILELLPRYHINSGEFRNEMQRFFGERTAHFLHELFCFASTPYDITGYDRNVQYTTDSRISTLVNEVISSSETEASVDSDIVMVSTSEPAEPPPGPSRLPAPVYPENYIPQPADNVIPIETISQSDTDDDSSGVMVVGYIKPPQDRTPEVVDLLGSDSDVIVQEAPAAVSPERPTSLVKLSIKRKRSSGASSSDSGTVRRRRAHSATTSDTSRPTPSPASPASASDSTDTDTSCSYSGWRKKLSKRKSKRKSTKDTSSTKRDKKKNKRTSSRWHVQDKRKTESSPTPKDKRSKRKSHSGKGVKSSKKSSESVRDTSVDQIPVMADQPSTSGVSADQPHKSSKEKKSRRSSRESKRLKSVVKVMYSHSKNTSDTSSSGRSHSSSSSYDGKIGGESSSNGKTTHLELKRKDNINQDHELARTLPPYCREMLINHRVTDSSDSEDNIPLNLTVQRSNLTSL